MPLRIRRPPVPLVLLLIGLCALAAKAQSLTPEARREVEQTLNLM